MSKKIPALVFLLVLLASAFPRSAAAQGRPCSDWESWISTLLNANLILTSMGNNVFETRLITTQNVGTVSQKMGFGEKALNELRGEMRNLGARIEEQPDGSFRAKFVKDDFHPCPPRSGGLPPILIAIGALLVALCFWAISTAKKQEPQPLEWG